MMKRILLRSPQIVTLVTNESIAQTAISVIVMILAKLTNKASEKIEVKQRVMDNYKTVLKAYVKVTSFSDCRIFDHFMQYT